MNNHLESKFLVGSNIFLVANFLLIIEIIFLSSSLSMWFVQRTTPSIQSTAYADSKKKQEQIKLDNLPWNFHQGELPSGWNSEIPYEPR